MFTWHFPEHTKPPAALPEFTIVLNTSVGPSTEGEADRNEQQGPGVDQINKHRDKHPDCMTSWPWLGPISSFNTYYLWSWLTANLTYSGLGLFQTKPLFSCFQMCVYAQLLSRVRLLATPWTAAYQAPPSVGFSRLEYWSGMLSPPVSHCWTSDLPGPWSWTSQTPEL